MLDTPERALILAPLGRDAALAVAILTEAGVEAQPCKNVPGLVTELRNGGGFALVAEEALQGADLFSLSAFLKRQPEWSDFQFILLTFRGGGLERNLSAARLLDALGNVTFLERPFHPTTLVSLAQAALRGRRRQYEARNRLIAIRESEERYRSIYEGAGTGIIINGLDGRYQACNPAYSAMMGYSEEELRQLTFEDVVHPEDLNRHRGEVQRLLAQEIPSLEITNRCVTKSGGTLWIKKNLSLQNHGNGKPAAILSLVTDITERVRQEEQIELLLHEVNHRSKNILTLVQAIARQTAAVDLPDFLRRFDERVCALAASQDLLIKHEGKGAGLESLIRSQLAHFRDLLDVRIMIEGPPLILTAAAAQALGMAVHELATNAGKYGALSNAKGRVLIQWDIEEESGEDMFVMSWRESGGPPVKVPERRGFGSTVISRMIEASLYAKVDLRYETIGLSWRLRCPAGEVTEKN